MSGRVLVTRPAGSWPALIERFSGGAIVIEIAPTTVQVEPLDPRPGERAIEHIDAYDWLVVTSGQGVKALTLKLAARGRDGLPPRLRTAAVGSATARALAGTGVAVDLVAADPRSEGLASALRPHLHAGTKVLVVRPEGAPGLLAAMLRPSGARVDEAPLYRTIPSDRARPLAERTIRGEFAVVAFTAPSSLDLWLSAADARAPALAEALARVKRVAIGTTTAAHLADRGLPALEVAATPDEAAVGDAIERAIRAATC